MNRRLADLLARPVRWVLLRLRPPRRLRDLLLWPVTSRLFGTAARKVVPLGNGTVIETGLDDELNRALWYYAPAAGLFWEPATTELFREKLRGGARNVVLAGTHIGYTLLAVADVLAPDARVVSFEPVPGLAERARRNVERNGLAGRIEVIDGALSDAPGTVRIADEAIRSSLLRTKADSPDVHEARAYALEEAFARLPGGRADLVFLDIEGYELPVLRGAEAVLRRDRPDLFLEVSPKILRGAPYKEEDLYAFLEALGYRVFLIEDDYHLDRLGGPLPAPALVPLGSPEFAARRDPMYFNIFATAREP